MGVNVRDASAELGRWRDLRIPAGALRKGLGKAVIGTYEVVMHRRLGSIRITRRNRIHDIPMFNHCLLSLVVGGVEAVQVQMAMRCAVCPKGELVIAGAQDAVMELGIVSNKEMARAGRQG